MAAGTMAMPILLPAHPGTWILGRKALGLRSKIASTAAWRVPSFAGLLKQLAQLQFSQYRPLAKHSQ